MGNYVRTEYTSQFRFKLGDRTAHTAWSHPMEKWTYQASLIGR